MRRALVERRRELLPSRFFLTTFRRPSSPSFLAPCSHHHQLLQASGSNPCIATPPPPLVSDSFRRGCINDSTKHICSQRESERDSKLWNSTVLAALGITLVGTGLISEPAVCEPVSKDADHDVGPSGGSFPSDGMEKTERMLEHAKKGIEDRINSLKLSTSTLPPFTLTVRGQQVAIRFPVSPVCDIWRLIVDIASRLGQADGKKVLISSSVSAACRYLVLERVDESCEGLMDDGEKEKESSAGSLTSILFEPLVGEKFPELEFSKKELFSPEELDMVMSTLRIACAAYDDNTLSRFKKKQFEESPERSVKRPSSREDIGYDEKKSFEALESMGVKVYGLGSTSWSSDTISWDNIAGYHEQKREIEDTVLLALRRPDIYESIARGTRQKFESNRPRAILFEGPPGTGKTSSARVIGSQAGVPLLYVPLEVVMSKYYGESERLLAKIFGIAEKLPNGAIIFLDEVDSLATSRDSDMHEATRRLLSVLLRKIDGFEQDSRIVVVAATNRKEDLDPALISRFDSCITFDLPDQHAREDIAAQYARHLSAAELASFAVASEGMSGRDIRDICQQAERRWASKLIRGIVGSPASYGLPPIVEYLHCIDQRRQAVYKVDKQEQATPNKKGQGWSSVVV